MKPNTSIPVQELGKVEQLDPFRLEPGVILLDRFCLVGRVRHAARAWTVEVTDLTRELGQPPHHRAVLHHIPAEPEYTKSLQLALSAHRSLSPSILGVVLLDNGLGVLSDVPNGLPIEGPLSQSQTTSAAVTLVSLVSRLHSQGILGVRFDKSDLFIEGATVAVNGFRHLIPIANPTENTSKSVEHDIANLVGFLREIGGKHLHEVLNPGVENIDELWSRLRVMREDLPERRSDIDLLPPLPPFVGRDDGLRTLRDGLSVARIARASLFTITGEKGSGKTRLIEHYCASIAEVGAALILDGTYQAAHNGTPTGLNAVIEQLPQRLQALSRRERNHIRQRIIEATGHQCGVLAAISPALNEFLGTTHPIPNLDLDEGFLRYAATVAAALQAIGTEHRPLILVLDNAEWADPASIAVLEHLAFAKKPHHTQVILAARQEEGTAIANQSTRISLQPLDIDLVERFLGAVLPGPLPKARTAAHSLLDQSKGNPLNIWLTLQNWVQRGQLHLDEDTGGWQFRAREAADPQVVELLRVRLDDLQGDAQWIALLVALQTGRSDHSWLTSITNWPKKRVSDATNSLIENAIIIEEPGGFLRFAHDGTRGLVVDNAGDSQLWRAHRCICNWIEQSPGQKNLALLAWHLEHATPPGDNAELTKLHLDGGRAMLNVYDLERSQWHFNQALQRTEDTTHRTDALEGSADVALLRGDTKRALQNYLECMENAGDPLRAVGIAAKATHAFFRKSAKKEALILAETALTHAGEPLHRGSILAFFALFRSIIGIPLPPRAISAPLRDALCQLYITLIAILAASEPLVVMTSLFRAYRHGKQLNTGEAASALAFFSTFRATIGHHDASRRHLIEAERIARRANSDRGLGVVQHMRGQNQLAIGNYAAGQRSLDLAIKAFRRTGDLSVAVLSLTLRALYGVNRESTSTTLEWLEDADSAAARQGNELARPAIAAMQSYVHLRSGRHHNPIDLSPLSERLKSIDASSTDLVVAHSYLALAGVLSGDIGLARDHAEQATHTLRSLPGTLELLHIAYVATAEVLLSEPSPSRNDRAKLVRVMKKIRNAAKQSPRFAAAYPIYRARHFISLGRSKEAKEALARVIETTARHGERYLTMQAHLLMADTVAGTDVLAAAEHLNMARNLAKELELPVPTRTMVADTHQGPIGRLRERPVHTTANLELVGQGVLKTRAEEVIFRLRPSLHAALPRHAALKMRVDSGIMVDCSHAELELLVVNLVLAARDAITKLDNLCVNSQAVTLQGDEAARLPGGRAGEFLKLEIVATGEDARTPMLGGLSNCRSVTRRLQGFLDIPDADENTICISAFLPAQFPRDAKVPVETALQSALVIHPDVRIRQALVTSLNELGIDTQEVDANGWLLQPVGDDCVVFADAQTSDRIEQMGCAKHVVHLVHRQEKIIEGKHCLRMPFSLGEIEGALAAFSPSSTDIAEQPG